MDSSLTNFELTESTVKIDPDSENGSGSDKSDPIEIINYDAESSGSNESEDDFDNNLPETVTLLKHEKTGAKVYLIGTAHFSRESQDDVVKVIKKVLPDIVILELCSSRTNILSLDEETVLQDAQNLNTQKIISTIRTHGLYNGLMYLLFFNMSVHLAKEIGMAPGGEFRAAYNEASKIPLTQIYLGDRPMNITIYRALAKLSWFQSLKLSWHLLTSSELISLEEIEKYKERDMLEQVLSELSGKYPALVEVFLDERDIYLTNSLQMAALGGKGRQQAYLRPLRVVGVVGIGHVPGIVKLWPQSQEEFVKSTIQIPQPSLTSKIIRKTFKISLLAFGGYLAYRIIPVPRFVKDNVHNFAQWLVVQDIFKLSVKPSF